MSTVLAPVFFMPASICGAAGCAGEYARGAAAARGRGGGGAAARARDTAAALRRRARTAPGGGTRAHLDHDVVLQRLQVLARRQHHLLILRAGRAARARGRFVGASTQRLPGPPWAPAGPPFPPRSLRIG
jgi:hypothetical protein